MRLRRLVRFGKLVCVHIETKLEITRVSPPHLVVPHQARYGSIRFVHTVFYSVPSHAVPGLEGSVNGIRPLGVCGCFGMHYIQLLSSWFK